MSRRRTSPPKNLPPHEKWCSGGHVSPRSEFRQNASTADGLQNYCNTCANRAQRRSYHLRTKPWLHRLPADERASRLATLTGEAEQVWILNFGSNRQRWLLYGDAIKAAAEDLRGKNQYGPARVLDAHYAAMCSTSRDVTPRIVEVAYPHEWRVVSKALRPRGPRPPAGSPPAKLYAIYLWVLRTYKIKEE